MSNKIEALHLDHSNSKKVNIEKFGYKPTQRIWDFHKSIPEYKATPLVNLKKLAEFLGVESIYIKDESYRFGLNAFKVLGGSYCVGSIIADKLNIDVGSLSFEEISSEKSKSKIGNITFVAATDGNHGRGIAWIANRLHQHSIVYMPKGSSEERLSNIKSLGSDAKILELNYDDSVRWASEVAKKHGHILVQDTSWQGYEDIPMRIMEGYTTMANEIVEQLKDENPTHIFLQAGVGAMAGAITAYFTEFYADEHKPTIVIVEAEKANCILRTAEANDGEFHNIEGDMDTIMAGLACGEPSTIGWSILKENADDFISIPDKIAAKGMRVLGNPIEGDDKIISGESGAATLGLVVEVLENSDLIWLKKQLKLNSDSKILCISTEGDTDKDNYKKIVWDGLFSNDN